MNVLKIILVDVHEKRIDPHNHHGIKFKYFSKTRRVQVYLKIEKRQISNKLAQIKYFLINSKPTGKMSVSDDSVEK